MRGGEPVRGDFMGLLTACLYFFLFLSTGIILACAFLHKKENMAVMLCIGCVFGIVLLQWLPLLFAFFFGFTLTAHILAGVLAVMLAAAGVFVLRRKNMLEPYGLLPELKRLKSHPGLLFVFAVWGIFCLLVLHGFEWDDVVYSSQATYGDMSMHLSFITSIATQGDFPPDYSILPGNRLSYPFLSDSISSSLYLLGAPLKAAYVLPMFAACAAVLGGFYAFACRWLKSRVKTLTAFILFFLNGGFGFVYFLHKGGLSRILYEFYETPTNLYYENIRWVNVLVDILLPQRASLFGWAVLFAIFYLLYRAVFEEEKRYFPLAGLLCAALPMIHTHSFLFAAILCVFWMIIWLQRRLWKPKTGKALFLVKMTLFSGLMAICIAKPIVYSMRLENSSMILYIGVAGAAAAVLTLLALTALWIQRGGFGELLKTWGALLLIVCIFALPQLFYWTFSRTGAQGFIQGNFGWVNQDEGYLWFYFKNLGMALLLVIPALVFMKGRDFARFTPALLAWFLAEFIQFQPNDYDNNKLLYPAFVFICILSADFLIEVLKKIRSKPARVVTASVILTLSVTSAILTIGREFVSKYELYGHSALDAVQFTETLEPDATFLTNTRHNNEIAALSGRNVVCGSASYLYFHGLHYQTNESAVRSMYEQPAASLYLYEKYRVDYIMLSSFELHAYEVDGEAIAQLFECIYEKDGIQIYRVNKGA